ncbi:hypothetical protein HDU85_000986 [Gaertneriomyces sp. JEL0708]|nr:hypothetical protein HDU85_000986 [Gaertneriomyces sp. JEL0708]
MVQPPLAERHVETAEPLIQTAVRLDMPPEQDKTLEHPNCVFQILRRRCARYTPEMVERITDCPAQTLVQVARTLAENSRPERTGTIAYAVVWTHHTNGVEMIRAPVIPAWQPRASRWRHSCAAGPLQHSGQHRHPYALRRVAGLSATAQPKAGKPHENVKNYCESETSTIGCWNNFPKYIGIAHRQRPLPIASDAGLKDREICGLFLLGQNPAIGGSNSANIVQPGLAELDWLVVRDNLRDRVRELLEEQRALFDRISYGSDRVEPALATSARRHV